MADRFKRFLKFSWLRFRDIGDGTVAPVIDLPAGWYFSVRRTLGISMSIVSAFDQVVG